MAITPSWDDSLNYPPITSAGALKVEVTPIEGGFLVDTPLISPALRYAVFLDGDRNDEGGGLYHNNFPYQIDVGDNNEHQIGLACISPAGIMGEQCPAVAATPIVDLFVPMRVDQSRTVTTPGFGFSGDANDFTLTPNNNTFSKFIYCSYPQPSDGTGYFVVLCDLTQVGIQNGPIDPPANQPNAHAVNMSLGVKSAGSGLSPLAIGVERRMNEGANSTNLFTFFFAGGSYAMTPFAIGSPINFEVHFAMTFNGLNRTCKIGIRRAGESSVGWVTAYNPSVVLGSLASAIDFDCGRSAHMGNVGANEADTLRIHVNKPFAFSLSKMASPHFVINGNPDPIAGYVPYDSR